MKSVSGLLNEQGGVILIGVKDDGEIIGLAQDLKVLPRRRDQDGSENHLTTLLGNGIGAAATANVRVSFAHIGGKRVCSDCRPSKLIAGLHASPGRFERVLRQTGQLDPPAWPEGGSRIHQSALPLIRT